MFLQGADAGDAFLWEVSQFFTQEHLCRFVKELTSVIRLLAICGILFFDGICNPEDLQNVPDDPGSHEDRARYQQIKVWNFSLFATMIIITINDGSPSPSTTTWTPLSTSTHTQEHGRGCCSTCCSGAFIVETMACVIINDQVLRNILIIQPEPFKGFRVEVWLQCGRANLGQEPVNPEVRRLRPAFHSLPSLRFTF